MKLERSTWGILAMFAVAGLVSWSLFFAYRGQADTVNIHAFPRKIGDWVSRDLVITEDEYAILETRNAFARKYTHPDGRSVYLLLVYSQHNRKVSHPPEICYTGSGAAIVKRDNIRMMFEKWKMPVVANRLLLEYETLQQVSYYWFKVGNRFTPSYWKQQLLIAVKSLLGRPASSALIRMAINAREEDIAEADRTIKEFTQAIIPALFEYLPAQGEVDLNIKP